MSTTIGTAVVDRVAGRHNRTANDSADSQRDDGAFGDVLRSLTPAAAAAGDPDSEAVTHSSSSSTDDAPVEGDESLASAANADLLASSLVRTDGGASRATDKEAASPAATTETTPITETALPAELDQSIETAPPEDTTSSTEVESPPDPGLDTDVEIEVAVDAEVAADVDVDVEVEPEPVGLRLGETGRPSRSNSATPAEAGPAAGMTDRAEQAEQIAEMARASLRRSGDLSRLGLDVVTDDLGVIRVEATDRQGGLQLSLASQDPATRALLTERLAELLDDLRDAGVDVGSLDVSGGQQHHRSGADEQSESTGTVHTRDRHIGPAGALAANDAHAMTINQATGNADGLDLRL